MRVLLAILIAVGGAGTLVVPGTATAADPPPLTVVPADPGVSTDVIIDHTCGPDEAVALGPRTGDLIVLTPLGEIGENPVVATLNLAFRNRLWCTGGGSLGCVVPLGDMDTGIVDSVVPAPCPRFGLCCEGADAQFDVASETPPYIAVEVAQVCGAFEHSVRLLEPDAEPTESPVDLSAHIAAAPPGTHELSILSACVPPVRLATYSPECATVTYTSDGIVAIDEVGCASVGGAFELSVAGDGGVAARSPCGPDAPVSLERAVSDIIAVDELGRSVAGVVEFDPGAHRFALTCSGAPEGRVRQCFVAVPASSGGELPFAHESGCGQIGAPGEALPPGRAWVVAAGAPTPPFDELEVWATCWSDTTLVVDVDDGEAEVVPGTNRVRLDRVLSNTYRRFGGTARCVALAEADVGLPSGVPACFDIVVRGGVVDVEPKWCDPVGASGRITLEQLDDELRVHADCPVGATAELVHIDLTGRVRGPVSPLPTSVFPAIPPDTDLMGVAARCVGGDDHADAPAAQPVNCYSNTTVDIGTGGPVVEHRRCGFVELRLPDTGRETHLVAFSGAAIVGMGLLLVAAARPRRGALTGRFEPAPD